MTRIGVVPALLAVALACGSSDMQAPSTGEKPVVPVAEVRLSADEEVQLEWDGTAKLDAVALDAQGNVLPGRVAQWLTSKPGVFTVSQTGVVTAVGAGIANLTASIEGVPATVGVRVKSAPVSEVLLTLPDVTTGLEVGDTIFVGTRARLASGQVVDRPLSWTSSDAAVATATSSTPGAATVVALGAGTVTLTGTSEGKSASVTLRVAPRPAQDLIQIGPSRVSRR